MREINRVEVPPNFGVNVFSLQKVRHGRLAEIIIRVLNPFNVASRLQFRSSVDVNGVNEIPSTRMTTSSTLFVATARVGVDSGVSLFTDSTEWRLPLTSVVTCFTFLGPNLLATGTLAGDIELWSLSAGQDEARCTYRFKIDAGFPIHLAASDETFTAVLSRGKCMLVFDTVGAVSGNTDESLFSPAIVDLLQPQPIVSCSPLKTLLATCNGLSVHTTDVVTQRGTSWSLPSECSRILWSETVGHLFAVALDGALLDCAWSNGLVGVSTMPTESSCPASIEKSNIHVNPDLVDLKRSKLVTCIHGDLLVYTVKSHGSKDLPISAVVTEFLLDKQVPVPINVANEEQVVGITLKQDHMVSIAIEDASGTIRIIGMPV